MDNAEKQELRTLIGEAIREGFRHLAAEQAKGDKEPSLLLSARQVAASLGVCERELRKLKSAGELPAPIHVGRLPRWRRSAIEGFVAARADKAEHIRLSHAKTRAARGLD